MADIKDSNSKNTPEESAGTSETEQIFSYTAKKVRLKMRFTGRVQGVGFRYTAKYAASNFNITGWVYNEYDGSVIMEAQGTLEKIKQLIQFLDTSAFIEIDHIEKQEIPLEANEHSFWIKDY